MPAISPSLLPILMLFASNVFMTFAWYGHLRFKGYALPLVIMASWGIAFFEYWLAVPANRWGSEVYSTAQLKTIQEVITLVVFAAFSVAVSQGAARMESRAGLRPDRRRRVFDLPQMGVASGRDLSARRRPGPGGRQGPDRWITARATGTGDDQQGCREQDRRRQRNCHKSNRCLHHVMLAMPSIARCCGKGANGKGLGSN